MELATGPLPWRASRPAPAAEHATDPWGEFLRRVLLSSAGPVDTPEPAAGQSPEAALPQPPVLAASGRRAELPAGQP